MLGPAFHRTIHPDKDDHDEQGEREQDQEEEALLGKGRWANGWFMGSFLVIDCSYELRGEGDTPPNQHLTPFSSPPLVSALAEATPLVIQPRALALELVF